MSDFNIGKLKAQMGGAAKPFLFQVDFGSTPSLLTDVFGSVRNAEFAGYMVRATTIPAKTIGEIPIPFAGLDLKLAGNSTWEPWTCTFMVDQAYKIRNIMERWSNKVFSINDLGQQSFNNPDDYMGNIKVKQMNERGNALATYDLQFCWPSEIGAITLSHEEKDTLETFDCTFVYSFYSRSVEDMDV